LAAALPYTADEISTFSDTEKQAIDDVVGVIQNCGYAGAIIIWICVLPGLVGLLIPSISVLQGLLILNIICGCMGWIAVLVCSIVPLVVGGYIDAACSEIKSDCYNCGSTADANSSSCQNAASTAGKSCYYGSNYDAICVDFANRVTALTVLLFIGAFFMIVSFGFDIGILVSVKRNVNNVVTVTQTTTTSQPYPQQPYPQQPYGQQPPAYGQQPPAYGQQPPAYGQQPPYQPQHQPDAPPYTQAATQTSPPPYGQQ